MLHLSAFLPSEGGMQVTLKMAEARARLLPSPLLGTVLPAVLGLLRQDRLPSSYHS